MDIIMSKKFKPALIYIFLLSLLSLGTIASAKITPKIIGGTTADSKTWPWMTGLVAKNFSPQSGLFCGASLIAKEWVLTAAHCVIDESTASFDVIINQAIFDSPNSERISAEEIIFHPLFIDDGSFDNDLALIKLSKSSNTSPIKLISSYSFQDNPGKQGRALGWGTTSATEEIFPTELIQVDLPIIGNSECALSMGNVTENMLCAGFNLEEKDTCTGDSGGPLIVLDNESNSWRQVGITSWGFGCAQPDTFGVYTRLEKYASFISDNICSASEIPDPVTLSLSIDDKKVTASWNKSNLATGYRLYYAPYPGLQAIYSIDVNELTEFSAELTTGSAFFVAITAYNDNCLSDFSNIDDFVIQ